MNFKALLAALFLSSCLVVQQATAFDWFGSSEPKGSVEQVLSKARLYRLLGRNDFSVVYFYDSEYSASYKLNRMASVFAQASLDEDFDASYIKFISMDVSALGGSERAELRKDLELGRAPAVMTFRFEQWSNQDVLKGIVSQNVLNKFVKRRLKFFKKQKEEQEEESYRYSRRRYYRRPRVSFGYGYGYPYYGHGYGYPYYGHHGYGRSGFSIGFGF